ncbi:MAG: cell division topological specificity factor MinE [Bdellovibrionota bacterium]
MLKALAKKFFGSNDKKSRSLAKSRLTFVLVQDRTGLTNDQMAQFRKELVEVIQRYFIIDETGFDISYERDEESTTLRINSPVVLKRQEALGGKVGSVKVTGRSSSAKTTGAAHNTELSKTTSISHGETQKSAPLGNSAAASSGGQTASATEKKTISKNVSVASSAPKGKRVRRQKKRRASTASSASANA